MTNTTDLDLSRWQRLSELLDEGLALEPQAHSAWFESLQGPDAELVPKLRGMLSCATRKDREFLSRPVALPELMHSIAGDHDAPGREIGPYRLISELGSGGMGTVWIAELSDGSIKRQVALKLPIFRWAPGLGERMRRERDILASLEHPNIARLYDAGVTQESRPYLALEYVKGQPIDNYCSTHALDTRARLQLFLQVAQAVSHAHGRLVVHRDLKPNNILVTNEREVRLLDFGIAKILNGDDRSAVEAVSALTRITGRTLTLGYASPEQIRGERVTIASDVYSLGVVLYELLTGRRPYTPKRVSIGALEDAITEQDARAASRVAPPEVARQLRGDLDAILAKALKKEIPDRYLSVESFAADIGRHLGGEPVLAQPDSALYRARKFIRRNARAVAAGVAVLVAIGAGTSVAIWQARAARIEAGRADEVKRFIASIFGSAVPRDGVGGQVLAADLLTAAASRIENELVSNPRAAAELGVIVGESFGDLGEREKGEQVLRAAITRAERVLGRGDRITLRGKMQLSFVVADFDFKAAEALADETIPFAKAQLPSTAPQLAAALMLKGRMARLRDSRDESLSAYGEAVTVAEKYLGPTAEDTVYGMCWLASTYGYFGMVTEQLAMATEALRRAEVESGSRRPRLLVTVAERVHAQALRQSEQPGAAIPILRQVVNDQLRLDVAETRRVREAIAELALALSAAGRLEEALPLLRKSVELEQKQNRIESVYRVFAATPLIDGLLAAGRLEEATAEEERITGVQSRLGTESPRLKVGRLIRGARLQAQRGNDNEAEALAMDAAQQAGRHDPVGRIDAILVAALNARLQRNPTRVLKHVQALSDVEQAVAMSVAQRSEIAAEKGMSLLDLGQLDEAAKSLTECHQLLGKAQIAISARVSTCVLGFARIQISKKQLVDAHETLAALSANWEKVNPGSAWHGESLYWLSRAKAQLGQAREARELLAQGRNMIRKSNLPSMRRLLDRPPQT